MYPEDRVLVVYVPDPDDFEIVRREAWYRIPQRHAPKGLFAEYYAFYFGRNFGSRKWAIHYYAERLGHELVSRCQLLPDEGDHPRAEDPYYKVQLGPLIELDRPIVSLRWRRIAFLHTTWDRFADATEINDLFIQGGEYVDRVFAALRERGIHTERNYRVGEGSHGYEVPLAIFCRDGRIDITNSDLPRTDRELADLLDRITRQTVEKGGAI